MIVVWASVCFAMSILLFGLAFRQFRRPDLPAWLASDLSSQLVCVAIVTLFAFGCGFLVKLALVRQSDGFAVLEYAAALALVGLSAVAAARFIVLGQRYAAAAAASADVIAFPPPGTPASSASGKPVGSRRRRKAA
jgi:hypothetical protein